jgi:quercetin dioxygenase-like cupin family protein
MRTRHGMQLAALVFAVSSCQPLDHADHMAGAGAPPIAGGCEEPASANRGKMGCYFDAAVEIGQQPDEVYWHVDEFADGRAAAAAPALPTSTVIEAYGRTFLYTVTGDAAWRPAGGERVATVGPMPAPQGGRVTARYMQAMTEPGAQTRPHWHDGPEAFVVLSGAICMESPDGVSTTGAGRTYWIRGAVPMQLSHAGEGVRRSIFIVLHPSAEPWMKMATDWTPKGACGLPQG